MTREEAIEILKDEMFWHKKIGYRYPLAVAMTMAIEALSQEPKTGHWIIERDCEGKTRTCVCDICGEKTGKYTWENPNYCSNCGAKMIEPQESEDKE